MADAYRAGNFRKSELARNFFRQIFCIFFILTVVTEEKDFFDDRCSPEADLPLTKRIYSLSLFGVWGHFQGG